MTPQSTKDLAGDRRYREMWSVAAVQVIRKLTGDLSWHCEDRPPAPAAAPAYVASLDFTQALAGRQQITLDAAAAANWARLLDPNAPAVDGLDLESLSEVLRQITVAVTTGVKASGWGETQIELSLAPGQPAGPPNIHFRFRNETEESLELGLYLEVAASAQSAEVPDRQKKPRTAAQEAKAMKDSHSAKLDLILDVAMEATLRFGGRELPLREIIDLAPGEVVELDRDVNDPVELLVAGKTVAWGEAVVVDGNYGLRVTRLVNANERLAALKGAA